MNKTITLSEMKQIEVSILNYISDVCRTNKLNYYLCGGTLLGAIRHSGFIPWDDDIDIFMPREDYMKLLSILRKTPSDSYEMMSFYDNDDYYYSFAKVVHKQTCMVESELPVIKGLGVYIDIFPIDGLPSEINKRKRHFNKVLFYRKMLYKSIYNKSPNSNSKLKNLIKYLSWLFCKCIGYKRLLKLVDNTAMKYKTCNSDFVACSVSGYGFKEIIPANVFKNTIKVNFENEKFDAPVGYDTYLSNLYGDYMKLPPEEKCISHHRFKVYWKNEEGKI